MGASPSKPGESNSLKSKKRKSKKMTGGQASKPSKVSKSTNTTTMTTTAAARSKKSKKQKDGSKLKESHKDEVKEEKKDDAKEETMTASLNGLPQWKPERVKNIEWPPKVGKIEKEVIPVRAGSVLAAVRAAESSGKSSLAIAAAAAASSLKEEKKIDNAGNAMTNKQLSTTKPKPSSTSSTKQASNSGAGKKKQKADEEVKTKKGDTETKSKKKKKAADTSTASSGSKTAKVSKKTKKISTNKKTKADKPSEITPMKEHKSTTTRDAATVTTEPATVSITLTTELLASNQSSSPNARMSNWAKMLRGEANLLGKNVGEDNDHSETRDGVSTLTRPESLIEGESKTKFGGAVRAARLAFRRELGRDKSLGPDVGLEDTSHGVPSSILRERLSETGGTLMERIKLAVARELEEAAEEVEGNDAAKLQLDAEILRLLSFLVSL